MNNTVYADYPQGLGLPEFRLNELTAKLKSVYDHRVAAKSVTGIETPNDPKAHRRQLTISAGFFMRKICAHLSISVGKLHSNYGGLDEAAKAGRFFGAVVSTLFSSPPVMRLRPHGGDLKLPKEAVTMTTTPTQAISKVYTFAIHSRKGAVNKKIRTISTCAHTESEARTNLIGLPLIFIKCLPVRLQEVLL